MEGAQKSSIFLPINFASQDIWKGSDISNKPEPEGSGILSGFTPFNIQIASIVSLTGAGGFFIDFTTVISAGVRVLRAERAASRIGIASARSASHSSLIPFATLAWSFATTSSALTI